MLSSGSHTGRSSLAAALIRSVVMIGIFTIVCRRHILAPLSCTSLKYCIDLLLQPLFIVLPCPCSVRLTISNADICRYMESFFKNLLQQIQDLLFSSLRYDCIEQFKADYIAILEMDLRLREHT